VSYLPLNTGELCPLYNLDSNTEFMFKAYFFVRILKSSKDHVVLDVLYMTEQHTIVHSAMSKLNNLLMML
jgi:hypothetical protein